MLTLLLTLLACGDGAEDTAAAPTADTAEGPSYRAWLAAYAVAACDGCEAPSTDCEQRQATAWSLVCSEWAYVPSTGAACLAEMGAGQCWEDGIGDVPPDCQALCGA